MVSHSSSAIAQQEDSIDPETRSMEMVAADLEGGAKVEDRNPELGGVRR